MPYVEVWVDPADADLSVFSDQELIAELDERRRQKHGLVNAADVSIPRETAHETLDEAAMIFRRMQRFDLAFKLDEIDVDYVRPA